MKKVLVWLFKLAQIFLLEIVSHGLLVNGQILIELFLNQPQRIYYHFSHNLILSTFEVDSLHLPKQYLPQLVRYALEKKPGRSLVLYIFFQGILL